MKLLRTVTAALTLVLALTACSETQESAGQSAAKDAVEIKLSDSGITLNGAAAGTDKTDCVYIGNDIIYYESGKDLTYGEGTNGDAHSAQTAAEHTVVHIAQPGTYSISGSLSKGQIAVDLGDGAKDDPDAVATLILNGVDINCEVAPAIIFYNVYECGSSDADTASKDVDTSAAGANVIIADGSSNTVSGSYVARIYKPESVVLNEVGTEVEEAKKLHKYDGAFYSKMSMNINGESENSGMLTINAENEGLDSELHLTINGGNIRINSGNDGINTNEDGVSVTTVNGGTLCVLVNGATGEGDGIDSNGWLVINGGCVTAQACAFSADAGIDSDMGIHINGGTVIASGNMLDRIAESGQTYAVFNCGKFPGSGSYCLKNADGAEVLTADIDNSFTSLIVSSADLSEGDYTLWYDGAPLLASAGRGGGMRPDRGEMPEGMLPPELSGSERPPMPDGFDPEKTRPDAEGMMPPDGIAGPPVFGGMGPSGALEADAEASFSEVFSIRAGANYFSIAASGESA